MLPFPRAPMLLLNWCLCRVNQLQGCDVKVRERSQVLHLHNTRWASPTCASQVTGDLNRVRSLLGLAHATATFALHYRQQGALVNAPRPKLLPLHALSFTHLNLILPQDTHPPRVDVIILPNDTGTGGDCQACRTQDAACTAVIGMQSMQSVAEMGG